MAKVLDEIYRIQRELTDLDDQERLIVKMCANLLESYLEVKNPPNKLTPEEYFKVPGRFELWDGMLKDY